MEGLGLREDYEYGLRNPSLRTVKLTKAWRAKLPYLKLTGLIGNIPIKNVVDRPGFEPGISRVRGGHPSRLDYRPKEKAENQEI